MKKLLMIMAAVAVLTAIIPLLFLIKYGKYAPEPPKEEETISVYIKDEDRVEVMNKNQYLKEVVSAEMPATFEIEALKAQAVAARSYFEARQNAYKISGKPDAHKGADICTDFTHCKAWISEEKRRQSWGSDADELWGKISRAVDETDGEVITYNDEIISAVFHSTSSGKTENSKDVWGGDKPYLVSVDSPGDKESPKYKSEKVMKIAEFEEVVKKNVENVDFSKELIGEIKRSNAGGVLSISVGGIGIKGTKLREILGLRSTNFEVKTDEKNITFDVKGYGHGVGMSQYGANYLASQGKDYKEILKTYYTGVEIKKEGED